jgi:hypothetical protein
LKSAHICLSIFSPSDALAAVGVSSARRQKADASNDNARLRTQQQDRTFDPRRTAQN